MSWLKNNSYAVAKMLVYQFGIAILGIILTVAASKNGKLTLMVSIYAVLFYLILLYTMSWDDGAKEAIRWEAGYSQKDRLAGLKLAGVANLPNFVIALLLLIGYLFGALITQAGWAQTMFVIVHGVAAVWESMYLGIVNAIVPTGDSTSYLYIIAYVLTPLPGMIAAGLGYFLGSHDIRLFGWLFGKKK